MLDNHPTISGKRILLVALAQAAVAWSCMYVIRGILVLPFGLAFQALMTFCVSQIACLALVFAENRKPTWIDFSMLFVAISLQASGFAPGAALSVYIQPTMGASDQRVYLFLIGITIWLGLIAMFCIVLLVYRLVIVLLGNAVRIVSGNLMRKKGSTPETFSIANLMLGTTIIAILLAVLSSPEWQTGNLDVPRQMLFHAILASLIPFFITWGLWVALSKVKSWWRFSIVQAIMLVSWPFVVYHLFVDSFLIKSRGLPVLFYDEFLPSFDKLQAVFLLIGISACVVQWTWVCLFVSRSWRNHARMERQVLEPSGSESERVECALISYD